MARTEPAAPPPARGPHRRAPGRRSRGQRVVLSTGMAVAVVALVLAGVVGFGAAKLAGIARTDVDLAAALEGGPENYLVVGSDSRSVVKESDPDASAFLGGGEDPGGQRSDTVMILRVDPGADRIQLLSLPRDLWVPIAGTDHHERINTAYALGGAQQLVDTIRQDFGIEINHYVEIDFASFKGVVQAVGGVPMYFDRAWRDTNSGLVVDRPGCLTLDGDQALSFARSRHLQYRDGNRWVDDPTGDLGRISRQQFLIRRLFDLGAAKVRQLDVRATMDLVDTGIANLKVDRGLDVTKLVALGRKLSAGTADEVIETHSLPTTAWTTPGGAAVLKVHSAQALPVLNLFRGLPSDAVPPTEVQFAIVDTSGSKGAGQELKAAFAPTGFTVTRVDRVAGTNPRTIVKFSTGSERLAQEVARHLTVDVNLVEDPSLDDAVMVVLGQDRPGVSVDARPLGPGSSTTVTTSAPPAGSKSSSGGKSRSSTTPTTAATTTTAALGDGLGQVPGRPPDGITCP